MNYTNKKFTMEDGKIYVVIEQVDYEDNIYLYIVNREDENDSRFVQIKNDELSDIDIELFKEKIFPLFVEKIIE